MRRCTILAQVFAASVLTGCAASPGADQVHLPAPPPSLTQPCDLPVTLPDRAITQGEAETFWGRDRSALRACAGRQKGLADWLAAIASL